MSTVNQPHVLVVDDNLTNLAFISALLQEEDYHVTLAKSGEKALNLAKESPPDIILLDITMDGWDGYETCQHLKKVPILNKTLMTRNDLLRNRFLVIKSALLSL